MASLVDVARLSGVSAATASRVLNPRSGYPVKDETRERVLAAAAELDYRSNALARGLKSRHTTMVAIIVHDIRDPYFNECARGVSDIAEQAGFLSMICSSDRDPDTELRYARHAREHRVAGLMFIGGGFESRHYQTVMRRELEAMRAYGGHAIALGPRAETLPAELPDNRGGAREATRHLIELGHERIGFLDGPVGLRTSTERLGGHREALAAAGLPFDEALVVPGHFSETGGADATRALLDAHDDITALFASNDAMALGALQELSRRGLQIPRDMSLIGFDDIPVVRWLNPPLTTIRVPMWEIGAAGMRRLLTLLESDDDAAEQDGVNVHPTELIVRGSTAAPREDR